MEAIMAKPKAKSPKNKIIVKNKVKEVVNIDRQEFLALIAEARIEIDGRLISADTILRIYDGDSGVRLVTGMAIAKVLGKPLEDLFEIVEEGSE